MDHPALPHKLKAIQLVGVASGCGAPDPRCEAAPDALRQARLTSRLHARGFSARWTPVIRPSSRDSSHSRRTVHRLCTRVAHRVETIVHEGDLPIVLGGDHTTAIGTWKGIAHALRSRGKVGLLWIDAHMDAHTPQSTQTGMLHGMPLACLLGHGYPELVAIADGVALQPELVCLYGVRSYEEGEAELVRRLGIRVYFMDEIAKRGVRETIREAIDVVCCASGGFGVTLDLDAIDPRDAPGVGTPAPGGMRAVELIEALAETGRHSNLIGIEIVEYNPHLDPQATTAGLVADVIDAMLVGQAPPPVAPAAMALEQRYGAHNYDPLPVVLTRGQGVYVWDEYGRRYFDMLSAYSAVSHGHAHPRILAALHAQAGQLAVTSRAYYNNRLPCFLRRLCEITGQDLALPANTGLEAVEAALKVARKWGTKVKGIAADRVEIIGCEGNFHGRSIAILALSSEAQYRDGFGPFPAGMKTIPYADAQALERAITPHTAAFLVEPIQGEAGIVEPPAGYLAECARICRSQNVLLICDEVQTGLGRTGRLFGSDHDGVKPDVIILGKALGGGLMPVSAIAGRHDVMSVLGPGDHGSTFAGNPLASAVAMAALTVLVEERLPERAAELGAYMLAQLRAMARPPIRDVRGRGLLVGVEFDSRAVSARTVCERLLSHGILTKDTHQSVVRFAPPLIITHDELDQALSAIRWTFDEIAEEVHGLDPRRASAPRPLFNFAS